MKRSERPALACPGTMPRRGAAAPAVRVPLLVAAGLIAIATALAVPPPRAGAHALLRHADPGNGAMLQRPPEAVTLTFTEEPEPAFSRIRVLNAAGQPVSDGSPRPVAGSPDTLRLPLPDLPAGVYTVSWRTVSRIDGHVTGGALAFGIGVTPASTPASDTEGPPPSLLDAVAHWLFYAGLAGLMGCAWVWTQALPAAADESWRGPWVAWAAAALGVLGLEEAQRASAGADFARFLSTWLGWMMAWRAVFVLGAAAALLVGARMAGPHRRAALIAAGVCASLAVLAHVGAGHAAAAAATWRWARVAIQWLHVSAIGAWLGGLAALLYAVGETPSEERAAAVRRFSTVAGILLGAVIVTGVTRAVQEVGAWDRLFRTPYGRLVLVKVGLLAALAVLGWSNRYQNLPQAAQTLQGLRRIGTWEVAVAAVALAVTAFLTQTAPASFGGAMARDKGMVVATGSDFATSMRARLEVSPGYPGLNRLTLTLRDYDTGYPVVADRVTLRFRPSGRPELAPSTVTMTRQRRDQTYHAQGTNLSLDGRWIVVAVVERGVSSVEIPLVVNMRSQPLKVRTIETPGQPTLYSIELPGGVVLDSYLDPGQPGFNEVHVTFISAGGQELSIPGLAAIVVSARGQGRIALPVRRFGPGHFIGDATLSVGNWDIEVTAATADGQVLKARFRVRV